jgi:hypothetical protein
MSELGHHVQLDGRAHARPVRGDMIFINLDAEHSPGEQISHVGGVESVDGDTGTSIEVTPSTPAPSLGAPAGLLRLL